MSTSLPPIYRGCRKLLVHTELMVMRLARYHKCGVGLELRSAAMGLMRQVNQSMHDRACQLQHVQALVWQVDSYKLTLQLAMDIGAFKHTVRGSAPRPSPSFHAFEQAAALAAAIGKQCGGWCQALARRQRASESAPAGPAAEHGAAGTTASPAGGGGPKPASGTPARPASLSGHAPVSADPGEEGQP